MRRAYLIEMTVLRDYARQLLGLGLFIAICLSVGMHSIVAVPGLLCMLYFIMGALSTAAYDEQNNWGLYRLTLPVSRRDVILGRYAVIVTLGISGMLVGLIGTLGLSVVISVLNVSSDIQSVFALTQEHVMTVIFTMMFCMLMGVVVASVETPIYVRFGQTKATQWVPLITIVLFIAPFLLFGGIGLFESGAISMESLRQFFAFLETPQGLAMWCAAALVIATLVLTLSIAVSIKLYERREL